MEGLGKKRARKRISKRRLEEKKTCKVTGKRSKRRLKKGK